jgi:tetratricopeptide (TPR) repeat protein
MEYVDSEIRPGLSLGDYRIDRALGAGGMGRVLAATHVRTGQRVAIKTLLSREAVDTEYFRREIETLSALRHEAIVRFRDHGVFEQRPWYAMDLLEGETLRDVLGGRLSVEDLLDVCARVLAALEHIHSRGIVHGDIKPENIFLGPNEQPILVDFGVASAFDLPRERLSLVPRSIGSAAYMAPERQRGALPDARADLYAVGCLLYECLTGTNPFLRSSVDATHLAHLRAEPAPPSRFRPDVPRRLDALVLRLLAKAPGDRPGYAGEVREVLMARHRADSAPPEAAQRSGYLYRTPLVGRSEPLSALRSKLSAAESGLGSNVLLRASRGMGKTRLLLDLVEAALRDEVRVLHVECAPPAEAQTQAGLAPLQVLLRALHEHQGDSSGPSRLADARFALDLLSAKGVEPRTSEQVAAARDDLIDSLMAELLAVSAAHPVLLAIDDVQHADEITREFLRRLSARSLMESRLVLVCTDAGEHADESALRVPAVELLVLEALTESEVELALRSALAIEHPSPSMTQQAYQVSRGNPLLLGHYLRALIGAGVLRRDRHQGWHLCVAPLGPKLVDAHHIESVNALFELRIRELSGEELRLASVAARLSTTFDARTLARIARTSEVALAPVISSLCARQILERHTPERYRFTHPILSSLLAEKLDQRAAKRIHRRAAAALLTSAAAEAPSALAFHLSHCGSYRKAARHFAAAGRLYVQGHHRQEALDALKAAIAELTRLPQARARHTGELFALHDELGDVAVALRQYATAAEAYGATLTLVDGEALRLARQYRKLASAHQRNESRAMECLRQASVSLDGSDTRNAEYQVEWIQVHLDTMWVHYWKQRTSALLELAAVVEPRVREFGTAKQRASLHFIMAVGLMQRHRYVAGRLELSHAEQALAIYEELQDRPSIVMCHFVRSMARLFSGDVQGAEAGFESVLLGAEKAASVTIRVRALTFLCLAARRRRARERVRRLAAAAHSLASEHGMPEYQGTASANLAWVAFLDGEFVECERSVRAALAAWEASPLNVFRWTALLPLMGCIVNRPAGDSDAKELIGIAGALLQESQQRLPDELDGELVRLSAADGVAAARAVAVEVLERATRAAFM